MLNLKKMGFDINIIKDKNLRKELISLLTIYLDDYDIYGTPYEKDIFKPNPMLNEELNHTMLINIADSDRNKNEIIDTTKKCFTCEGYKIKGNIPYNFDVIYDWNKETYTIIGYPIAKHLIMHSDFSGSFSIVYDMKKNSLEANRYSKNLECGLSLETHSYEHFKDNLCLISNYMNYSSLDIVKMEKEYIEFFKYDASNIYKNGSTYFISDIIPQSTITFASSKDYSATLDLDKIYKSPIYNETVIIENDNISIKPIYRKSKSLIINQIIAYDKYQKGKRSSKQKKYD